MTVLVTGATGTTGRRVADLLEAGGADVRRVSRSSPVRFDWAGAAGDAAGADRVFDGVTALYLLAPVGVADPVPLVAPVLHRAVGRGLRRVALLSSSAVQPDDPGPGELHRLVVDAVPEPTVLRPAWFAQNFLGDHHLARGTRAGRVVTAAGEGRVPFVDAADIAAVAARALLADDPVAAELVITGPEALTYGEVCALAARRLGHPVEHVTLGHDAFVAHLVDEGMPADFAPVLAALDERVRSGAEDRVTDVVARLTGREPRSVADVLAAGLG